MLGVLLALGSYAAQAAPPKTNPPDLYQRALRRALEKAQIELLQNTDLWEDHTRWEDPWIVESDHYQVRTTHSRLLASSLGKDLDYMFEEVVKLLGPSAPRGKFPIWIFPDLPAYNAFGAQHGAEHSSMYGGFYSSEHAERPVAAYFTENRTLLGMWVTHAAVHQYLEQVQPASYPLWIGEGLASYFALFWDWNYGARELRRFLTSGDFVPLERLTRDPIQAYADSSAVRFIELGMLFHYLLNCREDTKTSPEGDVGPFRDFLRALTRGQDVSGFPFVRLSREEMQAIEQDFKSYDFGGQ